MHRKAGFPVSNCTIKMPDSTMPSSETFYTAHGEDDYDQKRRLQLINFGHCQWGFNNWSWEVTKQDVDFVDFSNGKYTVGVAAFVSVKVKSFDIHRQNVGYATSTANSKGTAIHKGRKGAVTNALRETLLSFGGNVATELTDILESSKSDGNQPINIEKENHQNIPNKPPTEIKNVPQRKSPEIINVKPNTVPLKNLPNPTPPAPIAKAPPMPVIPPVNKPPLPANQHRMPPPPQALPRPNSNDLKPEPEKNGTTSEEEMRAERRRRQKQAQEEFRLKQLKRQNTESYGPEKLDLHRNSIDNELLDIATQDIIIEDTGNIPEETPANATSGKRHSPDVKGNSKRRASLINKLDIAME